MKIRYRQCPFLNDEIKELMKNRDNLHIKRLQCMSTTYVEQIIFFLFLDPCQNIVRKALVIEVQFCGTTRPSKYPVHSI